MHKLYTVHVIYMYTVVTLLVYFVNDSVSKIVFGRPTSCGLSVVARESVSLFTHAIISNHLTRHCLMTIIVHIGL